MELFDFAIPPFIRINFTDDKVKEKWQTKITQARKFLWDMEYETVRHGLRSCLADSIHINSMSAAMMDIVRMGLLFNPVRETPLTNGFASQHLPITDPHNHAIYGAIAKDMKTMMNFVEAEEAEDYQAIGKMLGYPQCCIDTFLSLWQSGHVDLTWDQAHANHQEEDINGKGYIRTKVNPVMNPIFKNSIRIGLFTHIPCSFHCEHTKKLTEDWVQLAKDLNRKADIENTMEILRMPVKWDALKGIASISTPVFKITTNSLSCVDRHVVEIEGDYYPEEAPSGLVFPWKNKMCK
jgi:hypothetical protein